MTTLRLIGIVQDLPRLKRLAETLSAVDFLCEVDVGVIPPTPAATSATELDTGASPTRVINIICWTRDSVGPQGADLQKRAITLKENNDYLGLLLDDVEVPGAVTSAQDVRLIGWDMPTDQQQLAPLIDALKERIEGQEIEDSETSAILRTVRKALRATLNLISAISKTLSKMQGRLKAIGIITAGSFLLGLLGLYSNILGTQDELCKSDMAKGTCRFLGVGHMPTLAQEQEWITAKRGDNCAAFAGIYGRGGPFAGDAKRRLDLVQLTSGRKDMRLGLTIPYTEPPMQSEAAARADLTKRGNARAEEMCAGYSQAHDGLAEPGRFEATADPVCEARGGGFACTVDGTAMCAFMVKGQVETCPPTYNQAGE